ncbi:flagellin [Marinovum sp. 2_MG-2023]|uniref:flagellin n=1 Tax=unclassified Marinovum TaxID=2647166 RepID=UPI0026E15DF4|nr:MULTISPECIES: flagellin [unclassified Marinovum]MDO6729747.1 flagellin [Marinovum sp. 2_MG-2023]MDO6779561.1 flagellin [Marinovum sp. 1_MG-2023]
MSSILTNNGAMVALQTLKSINKGMSEVQSQISTGKSVATAKDNSAVWAISKVMESDVKGFKAIGDSLSLGVSTVAVARNASETITNLLTEMKGKIVAAQEDNVDRSKINDDVTALKDQINAVVSAAQFNGLNLVDGSAASASILASLDRDSSGNVTASSITVTGQDLSTGNYVANDVFGSSGGTPSTNGDTVALSLDNGGGNDQITIDDSAGAAFAAGDRVSLNVGGQEVSYTVTADDAAATTTSDIVAVGLKNAIDNLGIAGLTVDYDSGSPGELAFTNAGTVDLAVTGQFTNAGSGGLGAMTGINVSTGVGATAALATVETLINTAISASSAFGSVEGRIEIQASFISSLTDSMQSGIGAMVDADMEEASARLQALQVQQQLGVQSLSIANQAPQTLLSLFR